jgi:hypothetical protein
MEEGTWLGHVAEHVAIERSFTREIDLLKVARNQIEVPRGQ